MAGIQWGDGFLAVGFSPIDISEDRSMVGECDLTPVCRSLFLLPFQNSTSK